MPEMWDNEHKIKETRGGSSMTQLEYVLRPRDDKNKIPEMYCPSVFGLIDDCDGTGDMPNDKCEKCWNKEKPEEVQ